MGMRLTIFGSNKVFSGLSGHRLGETPQHLT